MMMVVRCRFLRHKPLGKDRVLFSIFTVLVISFTLFLSVSGSVGVVTAFSGSPSVPTTASTLNEESLSSWPREQVLAHVALANAETRFEFSKYLQETRLSVVVDESTANSVSSLILASESLLLRAREYYSEGNWTASSAAAAHSEAISLSAFEVINAAGNGGTYGDGGGDAGFTFLFVLILSVLSFIVVVVFVLLISRTLAGTGLLRRWRRKTISKFGSGGRSMEDSSRRKPPVQTSYRPPPYS